MFSQGVFDIWFVCPYCHYESWARAYGVGEGFDTGPKKTASATHAMLQANVMAEHAAMRAVHGSPCPRCGQHHPEVVRWAAHAAREKKRQVLTRTTARTIFRLGIVMGVVFCVMLVARFHVLDLIALALIAATLLVVGRALLASVRPLRTQGVLYERTAPGVTFRTEAR